MGSVFLAIIAILIGAAIRSGGLLARRPGTEGAAKLAGYGVMGVGTLILLGNAFAVVSVGEVGVQHFLGSISPQPLEQGVHLINPLASIEKVSVREQAYPPDGGIEHIEAQTSEQLNVAREVSTLFRLDPANAPDLYQRLGSGEQIKSSIVLNAVRNGVRDAVATKSIEEKLQREQQVASERFQTEIIQERALQAIEEAKGIAEAQRIISAGLTPAYLTFHYIEQLASLPAGSVVYVPTEGGVPLMRSIGGGSGGGAGD